MDQQTGFFFNGMKGITAHVENLQQEVRRLTDENRHKDDQINRLKDRVKELEEKIAKQDRDADAVLEVVNERLRRR